MDRLFIIFFSEYMIINKIQTTTYLQKLCTKNNNSSTDDQMDFETILLNARKCSNLIDHRIVGILLTYGIILM